MLTAVHALNVLLPLAYLITAVLYAMVYGGPEAPAVERQRRTAFLGTLALHASYFVVRNLSVGGPAQIDTWTALSSVALSTAVLYAILARSTGQANTGGPVLTAVFLMQTLASAFAVPPSASEGLGVVSTLHVTTSLLASSAVILSGVHGMLYLLLYRQMRRRTFGVLFKRLPNLGELARMTRRSALAGFVLLGIGLNVGIGWAHSAGVTGFSYTDVYVLVILGLWIHFGLVAFSSKIPGLNAWRASCSAAGGLLLMVVAFMLTLTPITFHLHS